jgi:periplasmic protein TonB
MRFEAFLTQGRAKPRKARWLTGSVSLCLHGGLLVAAVAYSFWHVDELSPPTVTVTFLAATPPPPPPPPPKRRSSDSKPKQTREIVQPKVVALLQPKEERKEEAKDDGEDNGVEGGVAGGVGEAPAGPPPPTPPPKPETTGPKMLSGNVGGMQILTDPMKDPRYRVAMPPAFSRPGIRLWALIKICVSKDGNVTDVKFVKGMDPSVDPLLREKAMSWKYRPYTIDDRPVPFCYSLRYDHQVQ